MDQYNSGQVAQGGVQPPNQQQFNPQQYQFSAEELRALKECNIESFYQRSLPFGTALGVAAWAAVKKGMMKPSPKYGPIPKVILGVILGYFAGKVSYQGKCAEKIMRLPNSELGAMLRKKRQGGFTEGFLDQSRAGFGMAPNMPVDQPNDIGVNRPSSVLDMDISRPMMSGLDDATHLRGNVDSGISNYDDNLPTEPPKHATSYDELRKANREEYSRRMNQPSPQQQQQQRPQYQPPMQYQQPPPQQEVYQQQPEEPMARPGQKNKYGDVWT